MMRVRVGLAPAPPAMLHEWTLNPTEAIALQSHLRAQVQLRWDGRPVRKIAGIDMSLANDRAHAAIVVFSFPELKLLEGVTADAPLTFPYVPGLLSFREGPAILAAWAKLHPSLLPDVVMIDGQGIAHPRGLGIAAHMGLWLQLPTIGVGKSRLYGRHAEVPSESRSQVDLIDPRQSDQVIGGVLRTRLRCNPLYVSPGHLMDVLTALHFVQQCLRGYRLPEPTRWAHKLAAGEKISVTLGSYGKTAFEYDNPSEPSAQTLARSSPYSHTPDRVQ